MNYKKASFLERLAAIIVDSLLLFLIFLPLNIVLRKFGLNIAGIVQLLITVVYNIFFIYKTGSTIGKRLLRIQVVNLEYENVSLKQVIIRETIGKFLSNILLTLGYIWVLIDKNRQAWHDKLAGTYVVKIDSQKKLIPASETEKVSALSRVIFFALVIPILLSAIAGLVYGFVGRPIRISGPAMEPNYINGQYYFARYTKKIRRSDVIVYNVYLNGQKQLIKRVIGLPGETVKLQNSEIFANGHKIDQSRIIPAGTKTLEGKMLKEGVEYKIPIGQYLVLGDNREKSLDSRDMGFVPEKNIVGKVWFCYLSCN